MTTYFETISKSYIDVPTEGGIDTVSFLEASEGLVHMFDLLGNPAFSVVQNDMNGNIAKIRARYLAHPDTSKTLQSLVEGEKGEKKRVATEGLLWLVRGLKFTQVALARNVADKSEELSASFSKAYELTLKKYHSFVIRPVFALAMKACPARDTFYAKLGSPLETVYAELAKWLAALEKIVADLEIFYETGGHSKGL